MRKQVLTLGLLATLAASASEAAPLPGFQLVARSEHFTYYSRGEEKADPGGSERQLARVSQLLGQPFTGRSEYYSYQSPGDVAAVTGLYAGGVTYPQLGQVHTTDGARDHEIVHLVAYELGNPGPFFHEGLAVALGDRAKWQGRGVDSVAKPFVRRLPLRALMARFNEGAPAEGYAVAGSFVQWLIKRHGLERVVCFFRACDGRNTLVAFAATFGRSLEEAGAAWAGDL